MILILSYYTYTIIGQHEQKPFSCNKCHKSFALKHDYETHMMRNEAGGGQDLSCEYCDELFEVTCLLKHHMNTQHAKEKKGQQQHPPPAAKMMSVPKLENVM